MQLKCLLNFIFCYVGFCRCWPIGGHPARFMLCVLALFGGLTGARASVVEGPGQEISSFCWKVSAWVIHSIHLRTAVLASHSCLSHSYLIDFSGEKKTHSYLINCVPAKVTALWFMVLPKSHTHCWSHRLIALAKVTAVSVIVLPKKSHLFQLCGKITAEVTNSLCRQKSQLFDLLCCPKSPLFHPLCGKSHCWSHQLIAPASHSCSLFQQKSQLFLSLFQQKSLL